MIFCQNTIAVTLYDNLITMRDTDKKFELEGDILRKIIKKKLQR